MPTSSRRTLLIGTLCISFAAPSTSDASPTTDGKVGRNVLTYEELFAKTGPVGPVDDNAGFGVPADAAEPAESFEGTLRLLDPRGSGGFKLMRDDEKHDNGADSDLRHLAPFEFRFVQSGGYLIPEKQGLVITGSPVWNYIVGPGRVWREDGDSGYTRASFPFALILRNQNCVNNGEMTFLFSNRRQPNISNVRYQVTQETCMYLKFDMWGQLAASYTPEKIANAKQLKNAAMAELANRLPTKPISALAIDYPKSGLVVENFLGERHHPEDVTTYGLYLNGVNYVSECPTRHGKYAFCDNMRVPSYSIAKSAFAGVAMMWLGQQYGTPTYKQMIRNYVPAYVEGGDWSKVTFANASDMATGNYVSTTEEEDEDGPDEETFIDAEPYKEKIVKAFKLFPHKAEPGTTFVYQTSTTFILTRAMEAYLQQRRGPGSDLFDTIRDSIHKPLHFSQGSLSTLRTDNSPRGKSLGGWGLYFIRDDVAKLGRFLNNSGGAIDGKQVLDPIRLRESLFQTANPLETSLLAPYEDIPGDAGTFRYHNFFWAKHMTIAQFPQYSCNFWVSMMSGYGGNTIAFLPNGATFYIFSDGDEFRWYGAFNEINKIAPFCN